MGNKHSMGLLPKYHTGEIIIDSTFINNDGEHLLLVDEIHLMRDGWKLCWTYTGKEYKIGSHNPIDLVYSTTGGVRESNARSLASRLRNPWDEDKSRSNRD